MAKAYIDLAGDRLSLGMPPKKISKTAKLDEEIQDYIAGQASAKRKIQGMGGHVAPSQHERTAALAAYDMCIEGKVRQAHAALDLKMPGFYDEASPFYRQGYDEGFCARVRRLAYPGQRIGSA